MAAAGADRVDLTVVAAADPVAKEGAGRAVATMGVVAAADPVAVAAAADPAAAAYLSHDLL